MKTGWAGNIKRGTKVHIYNEATGVAICGYEPNLTMEWQWCSSGVCLEIVECKSCKRIYPSYKIIKKMAKRAIKSLKE